MTANLASIIIVNWNGEHLLQECLDSVFSQTYPDFEVIFVDNNSSDNSAEYVSCNYPSVKLISMECNSGFSGGNIEGLKHATGEFIVLLNNDARLSPTWLHIVISTLRSNKDVGFCASKILIDNNHPLIDSVGDSFTTAFNVARVGEHDDEKKHSTGNFVPGACAAAVVYKKEMLDEIGFLDADFFLNHEDTDLNMRAWFAGWKCMFVPEAVVYHKVSASIGKLSDTSVYYFSRNNEWFWLKNVPFGLMIWYLPHRLLYELCSCAFFCLRVGKWRPFLQGKWDALKGVPMILEKRKNLKKLRRLSSHEIRKELLPLVPYLKRQIYKAERGKLPGIETSQ
jgi:GT2 family glycosyltransferase